MIRDRVKAYFNLAGELVDIDHDKNALYNPKGN
jgi:hypothetical protein